MNIGIAGAGLMGRLLAWQLAKAGYAVSVFDKDTKAGANSAAYAAAAMLAPLSESVSCEQEIIDWGLQGLEHWPLILEALEQDSGQSVEFGRGGSIAVAHNLDSASLRHFDAQLQGKLTDYSAQVVSLNRHLLVDLEPQLGQHFSGGLWLKDEGYLDNRALLFSLQKALENYGVKINFDTEINSVSAGCITLNAGVRNFDLVIDTRGIGAKKELAGLRGVRGEIIRVHAPEVSLSRPVRLMHPRYQLYISPRKGNHYVIGATEIESESVAAVTVRSTMELLSALYSVHSGFAEARIESSIAQLRPAFTDNMPQINFSEGLLSVNGLYRHGYLLAPVMLEQSLAKLGISSLARKVA